MRKIMATSTAKVLLGAGAVLAATGMAAGPALASPSSPSAPPTSVTVTLPTPVAPAPAPEDNCVKGRWPSIVEGRPTSFKAGDDGAYLWHDPDGGWALRASHTGLHDKVIVSGTLTADSGRFVDVRRARDEGRDIVAVSANKRTVLFRFVNYGWVDGLDFATHCAVGFTVHIDIRGRLASTSAIHLGADASNPTSNPFEIERAQEPSGTVGATITTTSTTVAS